MQYRIVVKTERSGKNKYYVQRRFLWIFWIYLTEIVDMSMCSYKIWFDELWQARKFIREKLNANKRKKESRVIRKEVLYYSEIN